jgi:hypothetical protein
MWTDPGNTVYQLLNVATGTEAAQFPEKEYLNGIFLAVLPGKALGQAVDYQHKQADL